MRTKFMTNRLLMTRVVKPGLYLAPLAAILMTMGASSSQLGANVESNLSPVLDVNVSEEQGYGFWRALLTKDDDMTMTLASAEEGFFNPHSKAWLTEEQHQLLDLAYDIGYQDGGLEQASLLQAMMLQESLAGQLGRIGHMSAPVGKRSYGVMQVKVVAARDVLKSHPELGRFVSDEELIVRLMVDDEFNIRVASKYLTYLLNKTKSQDRALVAYNIGLSGARAVSNPKEFRYVKKVKRHLYEVALPYNEKYKRAGLGGASSA